MRKKIVAILIIFSIIMGEIPFTIVDKIYADDRIDKEYNINVSEDTPNLLDNYDKESVLCDILESEVDDNTTELPQEVEQSLNKAGLFDCDIENLNEEAIDDILDAENIYVSITYLQEDINGEIKELNCQEVEEVFDNLVEDGKFQYEKEQSCVRNFLQDIGIFPETVYAGTKKMKGVRHHVMEVYLNSRLLLQIMEANLW